MSGNARGLTSPVGARPQWSAAGALFNGVADYMATANYQVNQPLYMYIVMRQVTYTSFDRFFDGMTGSDQIILRQLGSTPTLVAYAGTASGAVNDMVVNEWSIVRAFFNDANSKIQINGHNAVTGNFGAAHIHGLAIAVNGALTSNFSNIEVAEWVRRDSIDNEATIYADLKTRYGISD